MDEHYMTKMATSFLEELTEIEKAGGIGGALKGFFGGAARGWGKALPAAAAKGGAAAAPLAQRMGIAKGGLVKQMQGAYKGGRGAQQGVMAGLGRVAQLKPVQMIGAPAALVGGGALAGSALSGDSRRPVGY